MKPALSAFRQGGRSGWLLSAHTQCALPSRNDRLISPATGHGMDALNRHQRQLLVAHEPPNVNLLGGDKALPQHGNQQPQRLLSREWREVDGFVERHPAVNA